VDLCRLIREEETLEDVPLVVAREREHLRTVRDLTNPDELLVRPLDSHELRRRIARARREADGVAGDVVRAGSLELNLATYQVQVDGQPVEFAYMEYELLKS
jgi:DNA-binding response OmpR family regulator